VEGDRPQLLLEVEERLGSRDALLLPLELAQEEREKLPVDVAVGVVLFRTREAVVWAVGVVEREEVAEWEGEGVVRAEELEEGEREGERLVEGDPDEERLGIKALSLEVEEGEAVELREKEEVGVLVLERDTVRPAVRLGVRTSRLALEEREVVEEEVLERVPEGVEV